MLRRFSLLVTGCSLALGLAAPRAMAAPWRIDPGLLPTTQVERLLDRYPDIKSAADLQNLLRDIDRRMPSGKLEARLENGVWQLHGQHAPIVTDIELDLTTRALKAPLYAQVQNYLGQVDSPEMRGRIQDILRRYLKRRGYPKAKLKLTVEKGDRGVDYAIDVNEGSPAVVTKIELGFRLPLDVKLNFRPGEICDLEDIEAAVSELELNLRDKGYNQVKLELTDVAYDLKTDAARVFIAGVLGQRIRYEIVDSAKRFLIDDIFADDELTKVDPTIVGPDAMGAELERRYRSRGFSDVVVKGPEVQKSGDDEFVYVYSVDPGKQYILKSVNFEGVTVFTEEELLETLGLKSLWQTSKPLNLEEIQGGIGNLRAKYQEKGFWDAKVRDPGQGQKDKETGTVRLTIQVDEGLPRVLHALHLKGVKNLPEYEVAGFLKTGVGDPLDRARLVDFQQNIRAAYQAQGYLYANVKIDLKAAAAKKTVQVDIEGEIDEGPRVKVGEISIIGLIKTDAKVVRRELLFESGSWYDPDKLSLSRQSLTRLGLFRSVQILPTDRNAVANKERVVDLTVDVREGRAGNVSFGPGWSLYRGWNYETEATYSNFGGVGRQASVRGSISEERDQEAIGGKTLLGRKVGAGYLEPWIFDLPVDMVTSANQTAEWGQGLWELSTAAEISLQHKLREVLPGSTVAGFYGQKIGRTEGTVKSKDELVASDVRIGYTGVRFNMDRRDNLRFPTAGYTLNSEFSWARYALGGDLSYFKWDVGTSHYFGLTDNFVFAINLNATSYDGVQRKNQDLIGILPPSERVFTGGAASVRGYRARTLGPVVRSPTFHDTGTGCTTSYDISYLDGTSRTVIKQELRYRLSDSFALSGFVDSGAVFFSQDQMEKFQRAYAAPVDTGSAPPHCQNTIARRKVEDNIGYDYRSLVTKPSYLWSRHYYSYGTAFNMLTALGSVNLAYGLPWHEPKTEACDNDPEICFPRGNQGGYWITRGEFSLDVGARF